MRTIDTTDNSKLSFGYWLLFGYWFLAIGILSGCGPKDTLEEAQGDIRRSEVYYQRAASRYQEAIKSGKNLDRLYLELGRLYFKRGEFPQAAQALQKSSLPQAKKIMAIAHYRQGDFTDALEAFNQLKNPDEESFYYQGLTYEKLNLFDQALKIYRQIKGKEFSPQAAQRLRKIEKYAQGVFIKDVDPRASGIIASAPAQDDYPQAGALILSCDEKIEVTPLDTEITELHYLIKVLNERGKEEYSEAHIDYDSTYEKIELLFARTIKPDGTVADVGARHIRDVSKYLNFPLYSNARVFIISFPEVSAGASIEYRLRLRRSQLVNKKDFTAAYPLQAQDPVIAADFTLVAPRGRQVYFKAVNGQYNSFGAKLEPLQAQEADQQVYRWQFKAIPQIIPEANMPPLAEVNPAILASTFGSWQEVYVWWRDLSKDKIQADGAIKEKVRELLKAAPAEKDKAAAIYNFCAREIRYVAVEYGQAGYEPHPAADIFRNKYGDCKDKAVLLVTMLREAGLKSWLALIPAKGAYGLQEDFPALPFNHAIAALQQGGRIIFLDPTAETSAFGDLPSGDQDRQVLLFGDDGYTIMATPLYPAGHNLLRQGLRIKAASDGSISARKENYTFGFYDQAQRYWLTYTQPELIREELNERIQEVSIGAKLLNYRIDNLSDLNLPVVLSYDFSGPEYFTSAGDAWIMPQLSRQDYGLAAKDARRYDLDLQILDSKENNFEITIPQDYGVEYLQEDISAESPWMDIKINYAHRRPKIFFSEKTTLKKTRIRPEEYPEFKQFFQKLAKKAKQRIVLKRKK